jgi:hypothetical protein
MYFAKLCRDGKLRKHPKIQVIFRSSEELNEIWLKGEFPKTFP